MISILGRLLGVGKIPISFEKFPSFLYLASCLFLTYILSKWAIVLNLSKKFKLAQEKEKFKKKPENDYKFNWFIFLLCEREIKLIEIEITENKWKR